MKPRVTVETSTTCRQCGAVRPLPAHLVVELLREDMWVDLVELLLRACDACGQPGATADATILVDGEGSEGRPRYLLLSVLGLPAAAAAERGRGFLVEHGLPPVQVANLVPVRWPAPGADVGASVLSALEADPALAAQVER